MRFYGLSFGEAHALPIRAFWLLNEMIDRIRAEEILEVKMPANAVIMGGDHVSGIVSDLRERLGKPMVVERLTMGAEDIAKAQRLFGQG